MARDHRHAALAAAALALLVAACGEDAEQVTATELVSRGDEICREGQQRFAEIQEQPPVNVSDAQGQTEELLEAATDELNELRNLRPPDELREAYDGYLQARGRALEKLQEGVDAAEDQDAAAYAKAQAEVTADQGERRQLAQAVGFQVCSEPSG